jgi:lipopolysaccharide heptosyltransferase II
VFVGRASFVHKDGAEMKILVIALAGIGDTLLATPLIRELRANFPQATLDALVLWPGARDVLETNPHLNRVFQKNLFKATKIESFKYLWALRREGYDFSLNTHPQSRVHYRFVARIIGAQVRISHAYDCSGWLDRWLVNRQHPQDYARHTVANNLDLLRYLDAKPVLDRTEMEVHLKPEEVAWAESFVRDQKLSGRKLLGVHVGSGGTKNLMLKRWPLSHYLDLIQRINRARPEVAVLLFGGPGERAEHEQIRAATDAQRTLHVPTQNLRQAAALLQRCAAFLSVDTALMHLAAAMRTRGQVVIETPTLNLTNPPYGNDFLLVPNAAVAGRQLDYYRFDGAGIKGTREELLRCMAAVSPEVVFQILERALAAR